MKDDLKSFMLFFTFFVVLAEFMTSFILYGAYTSANTFPNQSLLSPWTAYGTARTALGGQATGIGSGIINALKDGIAWNITIVGFYQYNVASYFLGAITSFGGLVNFPFTYVPYPYTTLFEILFWATFGIMLVFGIQIFGSGAKSGRGA